MTAAEAKLQRIREVTEEKASLASMDNNDPDDFVQEVQAILDDKACLECGSFPRSV